VIWSSSSGESNAVATRTHGSTLAACLILTIVQTDCPPLPSPAWPGFGRTPQHTAISTVRAQAITGIHWQTPVDWLPSIHRVIC